jgi:hypothetical protein
MILLPAQIEDVKADPNFPKKHKPSTTKGTKVHEGKQPRVPS